MGDGEYDASPVGQAPVTSPQQHPDIGEIMQRHTRNNQIEGIGLGFEIFEILQDSPSFTACQSSVRCLNHQLGTIHAEIAPTARIEQQTCGASVAASEVEDAQPGHVPELIQEGRLFERIVRIQRPGAVLAVALKDVGLVIERATVSSFDILTVRLSVAGHV